MKDRFALFLKQQGLTVEKSREVKSGEQLTVTDGRQQAHVTFYTSGTILVQGASGELKNTLTAWAGKAEKPEDHVGGWGDFPAGWREWWEEADHLMKFIESNGIPSEAEAPEQYKMTREMMFHDFMLRQQNSAAVKKSNLKWVIENWFSRFCFMGLDVQKILDDVEEYTEDYSTPSGETNLEIAAHAISFVMCNHCPKKFVKRHGEFQCPQVKSDQNGCAAELIDALYPFSEAKEVVAYTKGNLQKLIKRNSDVNWYSFEPSGPLEEKMHEGLRSGGLLFVPQYQAHDELHKYKVDFVIKTAAGPHIAVECDGLQFHARPDTYIRDRQRDRYLQHRGFYVMRFSSIEIFNNLDACIAEIDKSFWRLREGKLSLDTPRNNYFGLTED